MELATHSAVRKLIQPTDSVLEVGSRYGTTTCEVAVRQNNSGKLISVEPDHRVWAAAEVRCGVIFKALRKRKINGRIFNPTIVFAT